MDYTGKPVPSGSCGGRVTGGSASQDCRTFIRMIFPAAVSPNFFSNISRSKALYPRRLASRTKSTSCSSMVLFTLWDIFLLGHTALIGTEIQIEGYHVSSRI